MGTLTRYGTTLAADGAPIDALEGGSVFEAADVSPHAAAQALFDMEGWSVSQGDPGGRVSPVGTAAKADLWFEPENAALAECRQGRPGVSVAEFTLAH